MNIYLLCDTFVADYDDARNLSIFNKKDNFEEFYLFCQKVFNETMGQFTENNKTISYISGSNFMEYLVNFSKLRIDEDIEDCDLNNSNYKINTKKMVIISGHDVTLSFQQLFIIYA